MFEKGQTRTDEVRDVSGRECTVSYKGFHTHETLIKRTTAIRVEKKKKIKLTGMVVKTGFYKA